MHALHLGAGLRTGFNSSSKRQHLSPQDANLGSPCAAPAGVYCCVNLVGGPFINVNIKHRRTCSDCCRNPDVGEFSSTNHLRGPPGALNHRQESHRIRVTSPGVVSAQCAMVSLRQLQVEITAFGRELPGERGKRKTGSSYALIRDEESLRDSSFRVYVRTEWSERPTGV
jgi:hypothetical protein